MLLKSLEVRVSMHKEGCSVSTTNSSLPTNSNYVSNMKITIPEMSKMREGEEKRRKSKISLEVVLGEHMIK